MSHLERRENSFNERPIALNTSILANVNRDPKKQKKPYTYADFSFFMTKADKGLPHGHYGACALQLQELGKFPSWALFCFKELYENASKTYKSSNCALVSDHAIILSPQFNEGTVKGLLIAQEDASESIVTFTDMFGLEYVLATPEITTKVIAQEDIELAIIR
jgi:hypothetical protein